MAFAIKAEIRDPRAKRFAFPAQKTIHGGKRIAAGGTIFLLASETPRQARPRRTRCRHIGQGSGEETQPRTAAARVSITVKRTAPAKRPLSRRELNFEFYRQTTNKI